MRAKFGDKKMKKFKVVFTENCFLESTIILEGDFPEDEEEREEVIVELADKEFAKGNGTDRLIMGNCMDIEVKELE